jgi:hypothetical protein
MTISSYLASMQYSGNFSTSLSTLRTQASQQSSDPGATSHWRIDRAYQRLGPVQGMPAETLPSGDVYTRFNEALEGLREVAALVEQLNVPASSGFEVPAVGLSFAYARNLTTIAAAAAGRLDMLSAQ